jgi:hypothetical protein
MLVPWDYYRKRRNIQLSDYLRSRNVKDYQTLQRLFDKEGVECPGEAEYNAAIPVAKPAAVAKKPVKTAAAPVAEAEPKKTTRKRRVPVKKSS